MQGLSDKLNEFSAADVNLHLLTREKKGIEIRYGAVTTEPDITVRDDLLNIAKNQVNHILQDYYELKDYCPVTKYSSPTVEIIDNDQVHYLDEIMEVIEGDLDIYNNNIYEDNNSPQVWAFIITLGDEILMFQRCQPRKFLRSNRFLKLIQRGDGYFSKAEETILALDPKIDCISYDGRMYIFSKFAFEEIFGFLDKFDEEIKSMLTSLSDEDIIVDLDELATFCKTDRNKKKKLYKILNDGGFELLTQDNVLKVNQTHNLDLKIEDGKILLSPKDTKNVLDLMNKDCVSCALTDEPYLAHSKSPIKN